MSRDSGAGRRTISRRPAFAVSHRHPLEPRPDEQPDDVPRRRVRSDGDRVGRHDVAHPEWTGQQAVAGAVEEGPPLADEDHPFRHHLLEDGRQDRDFGRRKDDLDLHRHVEREDLDAARRDLAVFIDAGDALRDDAARRDPQRPDPLDLSCNGAGTPAGQHEQDVQGTSPPRDPSSLYVRIRNCSPPRHDARG